MTSFVYPCATNLTAGSSFRQGLWANSITLYVSHRTCVSSAIEILSSWQMVGKKKHLCEFYASTKLYSPNVSQIALAMLTLARCHQPDFIRRLSSTLGAPFHLFWISWWLGWLRHSHDGVSPKATTLGFRNLCVTPWTLGPCFTLSMVLSTKTCNRHLDGETVMQKHAFCSTF